VFTARYALSPYIKQIRFFFKGLKRCSASFCCLLNNTESKYFQIYSTCFVSYSVSYDFHSIRLNNSIPDAVILLMSVLTHVRISVGPLHFESCSSPVALSKQAAVQPQQKQRSIVAGSACIYSYMYDYYISHGHVLRKRASLPVHLQLPSSTRLPPVQKPCVCTCE
jgi:hypothetical protein